MPLEHVAFGLSINTRLVLYLSFALIRQKISEKVSCNTHSLKTEAHYILVVTTLEFLPLIHCCKKIFFPMETVPYGCLATRKLCQLCSASLVRMFCAQVHLPSMEISSHNLHIRIQRHAMNLKLFAQNIVERNT